MQSAACAPDMRSSASGNAQDRIGNPIISVSLLSYSGHVHLTRGLLHRVTCLSAAYAVDLDTSTTRTTGPSLVTHLS